LRRCAGDLPGAGLSMGVRSALLFASCGRYLVVVINLATTAVTARLLTPAQFGLSVLGVAVFAVPEALRELGSVAYLVQQKEVTLEKIRTVFTVSLIVTAVMSVALALVSDPIATYYGDRRLGSFLHIAALAYAVGPFVHPIYALMSRQMAFGRIALIDVAAAATNAIASIGLLMMGVGLLGLAWASAISAACTMLLGFYFQRDFAVFRPSLRAWRGVLSFGIYGSTTALLYRVSESMFYLIFGKLLPAHDVGIFQRSVTLATFPERVVLGGVATVALPAFSDHARRGNELRLAYLRGLSLVSAVQWPALLLLMIMAEPAVRLMLGPQWHECVPLMRIMTISLLMNFPTTLNYPLQVATGAIRATVGLAFVQMVVVLTSLIIAAELGGALAVALASLATTPLSVALSVWVVRRYVPFRLVEFFAALWRSAVASALSALGPAAILLFWGQPIPIPLMALACLLCTAGWFIGLWLAAHPMLHEVATMAGTISRACRGRFVAHPKVV